MFVNENRDIATSGKRQLDGMVFALLLVERRQTLSEPVSLNSRDRVFSGIEHGFGAA